MPREELQGAPAGLHIRVLKQGVIEPLRRGLVLSDGSLLPFFTRPLSAVLATIVIVLLLSQIPPAQRLWNRLFQTSPEKAG